MFIVINTLIVLMVLTFCVLFYFLLKTHFNINNKSEDDFPEEIPFQQFKYINRESFMEIKMVSGGSYLLPLEEYLEQFDDDSNFIAIKGTLINKEKIESVTKIYEGEILYNGIIMEYSIVGDKTTIYYTGSLVDFPVSYKVKNGIAYRIY